jgi:hypothetical protein
VVAPRCGSWLFTLRISDFRNASRSLEASTSRCTTLSDAPRTVPRFTKCKTASRIAFVTALESESGSAPDRARCDGDERDNFTDAEEKPSSGNPCCYAVCSESSSNRLRRLVVSVLAAGCEEIFCGSFAVSACIWMRS